MKRCKWFVIAVVALGLAGCSSKRGATVKRSNREQITTVVPSSNRQVAELVAEARKWLGTPYVYGGHSRRGTDCSGFTMEIFGKVYDLKLPRSSAMQQQFSRPVDKDDLQPGDLVFFATGSHAKHVNHVGLYIGDGRMIHASGSRGVMESEIGQTYWIRNYHSSGRVVETDPRHPEKARPVIDTQPTDLRLQQLYDALDAQIDSLYVTDPEIFD